MADNMSANHTANSTFNIYLRKLVIYVAKNPVEFVTYVFLILSPFMLLCGYLSWKLIQMMEQEKRENKRKGVRSANIAKTRRKKKAKPE